MIVAGDGSRISQVRLNLLGRTLVGTRGKNMGCRSLRRNVDDAGTGRKVAGVKFGEFVEFFLERVVLFTAFPAECGDKIARNPDSCKAWLC